MRSCGCRAVSGPPGLVRVDPVDLPAPGVNLRPLLLRNDIELKALLEIGGVHAQRYASVSVRSRYRWLLSCEAQTRASSSESR